MSVTCAEYFHPARAAISVTDRRWLYLHKTAPKNMRIWIGDFARQDWPAHWAHSSLRITEHEGVHGWTVHPDGTPRTNTQTTTFVVGRLFIHAYSCPFPEILNASKVTDAVDRRLIQIWPVRQRHLLVQWPPTAPLTDREADDLMGHIFSCLDTAGSAFRR
ncbi:hypothetical protein [Bradyrhizobium sp.]|uniref:hypothetical protein n=1 Tax=Bradyrhizobium sp. TaxID=376 RepID=UPI003C777BE3